MNDSRFQEALYIASNSLYQKLTENIEGSPNDVSEKLIFPLLRYYTRMCTRSTPFGLFAGCGVVSWAEASNNITVNPDEPSIHARLDNVVMHQLMQEILPSLSGKLLYFPNTSLYLMHDELRYVEFELEQNRRKYKLNAVEASVILKEILIFCHSGALLSDVESMLLEKFDIDPTDAAPYLMQLIENQLLVSQLEPTITGEEYLPRIIDFLKKTEGAEEILSVLEKVNERLLNINAGSASTIEEGRHITSALKSIVNEISENKLFQIDRICNFEQESVLNAQIQNRISEAVSVLNALTPGGSHRQLEKFTQRFSARYDTREMPLAEVLDAETGIGYMDDTPQTLAPLLEGLVLSNALVNEQLVWNDFQKWRWNLLQNARSEQAYSVAITDKMIEEFSKTSDDLPPSISVMFKLIEGDLLYLENVGGVSATNLINRFAHADPAIHSLSKDISEQEQRHNRDVIFAEIVHLPERRVGNIMFHPGSRTHEIPYLAASSVDAKYQIKLQDLHVSIRNGRIVLRSKKLNKEVVPRLSSAYNYSRSDLPVYRFLCDLQTQGLRTSLNFSWGQLESRYKFLPRVTHKQVVLHPATWQFRKDDLASLQAKTATAFSSAFALFRKKWKLPQYWILADGDNELFVNSDDMLLVKAWWDLVKNRQQIVIKEYFYPQEGLVRDGQRLTYANQFIASLIKDKATYGGKTQADVGHQDVVRTFTPGSEWVYYKIYCGTSVSDRILAEALLPAVELLLSEQKIRKWFFIRYYDSENHLRVRFHLSDLRYLNDVLTVFKENLMPFEQSGLIGKIQLDTYQRELERYGFLAIEEAEAVFCSDSKATLQFLEATEGDARESVRWLWCLKSIDVLLDDFQYSLEEKCELLQQMKEYFAAEFDVGKPQRLQLDKKYRSFREDIKNILDPGQVSFNNKNLFTQILEDRSHQNQEVIRKILSRIQAGQLNVSLNELVSSYVHMAVNRIMPGQHRLYEMVQYDFLYRHYRSQVARKQKAKAV